jgi:pyruvate/2-oxoglutarate dehydrogenase complex dihydrolipoamide acyltransferase (E2) component
MAQPIKEEYGSMEFLITDTTHITNLKKKMKTLIFTTDPNDRLYSFEEQKQKQPKYYLPFYINIFNIGKTKSVNDIIKVELKDLFIKEFIEFITITLKQELSPKACINFIKDKSLVTRFISEYKTKRPREYEQNTRDEDNENRYKTFLENVYIYLIKIIFTPAGSFIYQKPSVTDIAADKVADDKRKQEKDEKKKAAVATAKAINQNPNATPAQKAAADAEVVAADADEEADEADSAKPIEIFSANDNRYINTLIRDFLKDEATKYFSIDTAQHIKLAIKETKKERSLTKTILDSTFEKEKTRLLQQKPYGYVSELDYNIILKDQVLIALNNETKAFYRKSEYKVNTDLNNLVQALVETVKKEIEKLNLLKKESTIIKNEIDIRKDIINLIKTFYIEKKKNELQREKKINILIKLTNDIISDVSITNKQFVGTSTATLSDVLLFQKKIREEISKYVKNCQTPKDIEDNLKKECDNICNQDKPDLKNKLWCNICENYIQCVYDQKYITIASKAAKAEEAAAEAKAKAEEANTAAAQANPNSAAGKAAAAAIKAAEETAKNAEEEKKTKKTFIEDVQKKTAEQEENKKKLFYINFKKAAAPAAAPAPADPAAAAAPAAAAPAPAPPARGGGSGFQYKTKTISKKHLLKPKRKESFKILK